jgi:hypothetical protein
MQFGQRAAIIARHSASHAISASPSTLPMPEWQHAGRRQQHEQRAVHRKP